MIVLHANLFVAIQGGDITIWAVRNATAWPFENIEEAVIFADQEDVVLGIEDSGYVSATESFLAAVADDDTWWDQEPDLDHLGWQS